MAAKTFSVRDALVVDGLADSIRGLRKAKSDLPKVIAKTTRDQAKKLLLPVARGNWKSQPIQSHRAARAITVSATATGAAIRLRVSAVPSAAAVEFGTHIHFVFGRPVSASQMKRRVFKPWRGNQFTVTRGSSTGYVVQDAIRDTLPKVEATYHDEIEDAIAKWVRRG